MSLQGPLLVVADAPAAELVQALSAAGAFPIVESTWADSPTAFASVKPAAVIIAAPGSPPSESAARMLCLQIATAKGALVPVIAATEPGHEPALPVALPVDGDAPFDRLLARLQSALRVREMHAAVLRRADIATADALTETDALDEATVLVVGRGLLSQEIATVLGRVKSVVALSVEGAAKQLNGRDIDGVIVGDGLSPLMNDAFLAALADDPRFRDLPVAVIGRTAQPIPAALPNVDPVDAEPRRIVARMRPMIRLHAFGARLVRALAAFDSGGVIDPETGLMMPDAFAQELGQAIAAAAERSQPLSLARFSFDGLEPRAAFDAARLVTRLVRTVDFASRDETGAILMAFTQTDLRSAHVVARRIAGALKAAMPGRPRGLAANVTLATWKAGDSVDTLMLRVTSTRMVAAE
jgi:hypothetical protein